MMIDRLLVGALALALAGCGHPLASVKNTSARYEASTSADGRLAAAEQEIVAAQRLQQRQPLEAIGKFLSAAEAAANRLREQPKDAAALRDYNFALSRVFSAMRAGHIDAWSQPLSVPGYVVTHRKDTRAMWNPADYEFTPCDELVVGGTAFHDRARREGLGAPVLATRRTAVKDFKKLFFRTEHVYYGVTAVATFQANRCEIALEDPLGKQTVALGGRSFPLAGDFSTAVATFLVREKPQKLGLTRTNTKTRRCSTACNLTIGTEFRCSLCTACRTRRRPGCRCLTRYLTIRKFGTRISSGSSPIPAGILILIRRRFCAMIWIGSTRLFPIINRS
jgi:hypothetical protein